jgi:hypothetical protein
MPQARSPRWFTIPVRVVLVTFICTLLVFAVSLGFGIIGTLVVATLRHVHPDMRVAYRLIALPVAIVAGGVIFIVSVTIEVRHYRQAKMLAAIERVS